VEKPQERIPEGHVLLTWKKNIGVVYEYKNTKVEDEDENEEEEDIHYEMSKAVAAIEERRIMYRMKDLENYGYDHYTQEFYYEPEESDSDEEIET
jgi:hypothetical protein